MGPKFRTLIFVSLAAALIAGLIAHRMQPEPDRQASKSDPAPSVVANTIEGSSHPPADPRQATADLQTQGIAGRVTVDGQRPEKPIQLGLYSNQLREPLVTRTDLDGHFRFAEKQHDWDGRIQVQSGYAFQGMPGETRMRVDPPYDQLEIDLVREPHLVGRVVAPGGKLAGNARIHRIAFERDESVKQISPANRHFAIIADSEGRFEAAISEWAQDFFDSRDFRELLVDATDSEERWSTRAYYPAQELRTNDVGDVDLGDIFLSEPIAQLRIVDEGGSPISGARAREIGVRGVANRSPWSRPSDESGHTSLTTPIEDPVAIATEADGYWHSLQEPDASSSPLVLKRANRLDIRVESSDNRAIRDLNLRVARLGPMGPSPTVPVFPFYDSRERLWIDQEDARWDWIWDDWAPEGFVYPTPRIKRLESETLSVTHLWPNERISVAVIDADHSVLAEQQIVIGASEQRSLTLVLSGRLHRMMGRVIDPHDRPIPGARIRVKGQSVYSDSQGLFEISGLTSPLVSLLISASDYQPKLIQQRRIPLDESIVEFALEPGDGRATVRVHDEAGAPVLNAGVFTTALGEFQEIPLSLFQTSEVRDLDGVAPGVAIGVFYGDELHVIPSDASRDHSLTVRAGANVTLPWPDGLQADESSNLVVGLIPLDPELPTRLHPWNLGGDRVTIDAVRPGTYRAAIRRVRKLDEQVWFESLMHLMSQPGRHNLSELHMDDWERGETLSTLGLVHIDESRKATVTPLH